MLRRRTTRALPVQAVVEMVRARSACRRVCTYVFSEPLLSKTSANIASSQEHREPGVTRRRGRDSCDHRGQRAGRLDHPFYDNGCRYSVQSFVLEKLVYKRRTEPMSVLDLKCKKQRSEVNVRKGVLADVHSPQIQVSKSDQSVHLHGEYQESWTALGLSARVNSRCLQICHAGSCAMISISSNLHCSILPQLGRRRRPMLQNATGTTAHERLWLDAAAWGSCLTKVA